MPSSGTTAPDAATTTRSDGQRLDVDHGPDLIALAACFMAVDIIFVCLRFWSRRIHRTPIGLDDYVIYPALAVCLCLGVSSIVIVPVGGVGTHTAKLAAMGVLDEKLAGWARCLLAVQLLYYLAVCVTKLALLALFRRVLREHRARRVINAIAAFTLATFVASAVADLCQCTPFDYQWNRDRVGGRCFDRPAFWSWSSLPNILTDVALLVLPVPTVWRLNATRSQKIQLSVAFAVSSFGLVASVVRFSTFFTVKALSDPTYSSYELIAWTNIEASMYLITACLPTLRPLLNVAVAAVQNVLAGFGWLSPPRSAARISDGHEMKKGTAIASNHTIGSRQNHHHHHHNRHEDEEDVFEDVGKYDLRIASREGGIMVTRDFSVHTASQDSLRREEPTRPAAMA